MYSFLLLSIPAVTLCYCFCHSEYDFRNFLIPIFFGVLAGILTSAVREFFIFSVRIPEGSVIGNMMHLSKSTLFPCLVLCGVFTILSKDDELYKTAALFPLTASFYAVYLPYIVISGPENRSFFLLFISPVLTLSTVSSVQAAAALIKSKAASCGIKKALPYVMLFPAAALIQPAIQALWHCKAGGILHLVLAALFAAAALIFHKFTFRKANSLDTVL